MLRSLLPTLRTALPRPMVARAAIALPARPQPVRFYAAGAGLSRDAISERIMDVFKGFEKVKGPITADSSLTKDLGLDSLDAVEVVMAIEEEFAIEIPDEEADAIHTVGQAIDYISKTPEAH